MFRFTRGYQYTNPAGGEFFIPEKMFWGAYAQALEERIETINKKSKRYKNWIVFEEIWIACLDLKDSEEVLQEDYVKEIMSDVFGKDSHSEYVHFSKILLKYLERVTVI